MPDGPEGERPEYKVYRSRRGLLDRLRPREELPGLRPPERREPLPSPEPRRPGPRIGWRRILKWVALAVGAWLLLSFVVFLISATLNEGVSDSTENALSGGGSLLTGSTILVLGSDARSAETREPGSGGPARSDSVLVMHVAAGSVRRVSILRDSFAEIPGHGSGKINAAFALGGSALAVETVEGFLGNGLKVNHVMEVSFDEFPELIDALGGVDVEVKRRICAPPFGNFPRGVRLGKGEHHLNGRRALGFARVRKNPCAPSEDDQARAERQQEVMRAIRSRLLSPSAFIRLPWVSWEAPRTIKTDLRGPGLSALFIDLLSGGSGGKPRVLKRAGVNPDGSLVITREERTRAVLYLEEG